MTILQSVAAGATDRSLFEAETKFASGKEEADFYLAALQKLTLFKSRSERALLDMQSRAASAQREAADAKQRYEHVRRRPGCSVPCSAVNWRQSGCASRTVLLGVARARLRHTHAGSVLFTVALQRGHVSFCLLCTSIIAPHACAPHTFCTTSRRSLRQPVCSNMQMYASMRAAASNSEELQSHITNAMASKAEWESKVQVLQQELQSLAHATPELLEQLQYEADELQARS